MSTQLDKIMHSTFANSKRFFRIVTALQWLLAFLGTWVILSKSDNACVVLAVFIGSLAVVIIQQIGKLFYARGERIRRAYMLREGLGISPSDSDLLDILSKEPAAVPREPQPIQGYYSSSAPYGTSKFLHQLHESAFWTSALARFAAYVNYSIAGVGLLLTMGAALLLLHTGNSGSTSPDYARLFANLLLFFLAGSTLSAGSGYWALSNESGRVADQASNLRQDETPDMVATLRLVARYDIALAKCLPLPTYAYKILQAKLHASWKEVCGKSGRSSY